MAPQMSPPSAFPTKTALALASAIALLAGLHAKDHGKGLNPGIFQSALQLNLLRHTPQANQTAIALPATPPNRPVAHPGMHATSQPAARAPISAYLDDGSGALDSFYAALRRLQLPAEPDTTTQVVTVLHYGDSPTTADLITGDIRQMLQQSFGDAGHGYLLIAKPWAWYGHRGVDLNDHGWSESTAVGKGREETYGLGGASFSGGGGAGSTITLHDDSAHTQRILDLEYWAQPNGGELSVAPDNATATAVTTADTTAHPAWHRVALAAGVKSIELKPTSGSVRLFGEDLRTGGRGILYDSLGLNGASTSVLSNGVNAAAWTEELKHAQPALVVINYGTNESSFGSYVDKQYEPTLRTTIARIRAAVSGVAILIMSPMDRGRRTGVDQIETYDTIPRIVAIQRRVAAELNCAFFDTFDAMGGDGTMARWYNGHPRLVAGDLIHPTPQGASLVAQLFVGDLMLGYQRFLNAYPDGRTVSSPALPVRQPAPGPAPAHPRVMPPSSPAAPKPSGDKPLPAPTGQPDTNSVAPPTR